MVDAFFVNGYFGFTYVLIAFSWIGALQRTVLESGEKLHWLWAGLVSRVGTLLNHCTTWSDLVCYYNRITSQ